MCWQPQRDTCSCLGVLCLRGPTAGVSLQQRRRLFARGELQRGRALRLLARLGWAALYRAGPGADSRPRLCTAAWGSAAGQHVVRFDD